MKPPNGRTLLAAYQAKMRQHGLRSIVIDIFSYYFEQVVSGQTGLIYDRDIRSVHPDEIEDADNLQKYSAIGKKVLKNAVMIILNGGLGTSMGLQTAKSLLEVKFSFQCLKMHCIKGYFVLC